MITKEQALEKVRADLASPEFTKMAKNYLIRTVYDYDGAYHFTVTPGTNFDPFDPQIFEEVVNKKTGNIEMINPSTIVEGFMEAGPVGLVKSRKYLKAVKASEPVDLNEKQWTQMQQCINSF